MIYLLLIVSVFLTTWSLLKISDEIKQLRRYLEYLENKNDNLINSDTNPQNVITSVNTGVIPINDNNNSTDADTLGAIPPITELDEMIDKALKEDQLKTRPPKLEKLKNFTGVKAYKKSTPTNKKAWFNISQGDILRVIETGELITVQAINKRGNRKFYLCLNSAGVQCTYKREQLEKVKN